MKPYLTKNDEKLFYKYIDRAISYFEYGSGGSTYQVSLRKNIKSIFSVESDPTWYDKMKKETENNSNVKMIFVDIKSCPNNWGSPGEGSSPGDWKKYSDCILKLPISISSKIDLILIDGRFRVACALKCFTVMNKNCLIIFDDFLTRSYYHVVLDYFEIIDKTADNRMVVLKKKNVAKPLPNLIKKYEAIKE